MHRSLAAPLLAALALLAAGSVRLSSVRDEEEFTGAYVSGFEASEFYPGLRCPENIPWWLDAEPDSGFFERLQDIDPEQLHAKERVRFYRVRVAGRVSPPGRYGHLGVYPQLITVSSVLDAETAPDCDPYGR
jgi:hypothetical protein